MFGVRPAREEHGVRPDGVTARERDGQPAIDPGNRRHARAQDLPDPVAGERLRHQAGQLTIHGRQQALGVVNQGHRDTERREDRGELDADRTAADDHDVVRDLLDGVDPVGVVDVRVVERDARGVGGTRPARDQDRTRGQLAAGAIGQGDEQGAARDHAGGAVEVVDALPGDLVRDGLLEAVDHRAGPGGDDREGGIQWHRRPDAVDLFLAEAGQGERGLAQRLGRGTPRGGHGAARPVPLDDDHPATEVDRQFGRGLAGRARTDHRQIVARFHGRCPSAGGRLRCRARRASAAPSGRA